jgi:predicted nucleic acid-binding Zn ribbon protein
MFCSNCGHEIDSGERFCSKCGAPAKRSANSKKSISPLANILIILAVVFLIAGVILAVVFLSKSNQKTLEINSSETTADDISTNETSAGAGKAKSAETTASEMTAAGTTSGTTASAASDYNIGDTGPAGGFIFYINPNYATDGWKYLEAAPGDFPGDNNDYYIQWPNGNNVQTDATATAIGTGMSNTQKIVDIQGNGSYAAKLCFDLTQGGYSDWFLPSKDLIYENLFLKDIVSFEPIRYWSSSEVDADGAWYQNFGGGSQGGSSKDGDVRVRAVCAF